MPAASISRIALAETNAGYNLTDSADFNTLVAGAGNGVTFDYGANDVVVLKNDTAGAAVFTLKIVVVAGYTSYGAGVTNPTRSVAAGKTYLMRLDANFKDASNKVTIECDIAGKVLVVEP